jgi:hypothetical protein
MVHPAVRFDKLHDALFIEIIKHVNPCPRG